MGKGGSKKPRKKVPPPKKEPGNEKKPRSRTPNPLPDGALKYRFTLFDNYLWYAKDFRHPCFTTIADKLKSYEGTTWTDLTTRQRGDHTVDIGGLCAKAQKQLQKLKLDDHDQLWSLRLTGQIRLWGVRMEGVFYVLWWDPEHAVCPSKKKHT